MVSSPHPAKHLPQGVLWERWLADNHATADDAWLQIPKMHATGIGVPITWLARERARPAEVGA